MIKKSFLFCLILISGRISAQVNLQTGSATFSLPMFSWQENKSRLNSVVALNYSSGNGLKVSDIASNAGQGWELLAGGVITRIQHGEPDDQQQRTGNGTIEDVSKYPPGYLYDPLPATQGVPGALAWYPIFKDKNHIYKQHNTVAADKELDRFAFQFNGRSGIFIVDKNSLDQVNNKGNGVLLGDSKMKVTFVTQSGMSYQGLGIRTTITSFTIQDENGLIYKFTQHQLTKVLKTQYCDKNLNKITQPKFKNGKVENEASFEDAGIINPYIINSWYLTEIEDALTHRKINFNYTTPRNITTANGIALANHTSNNSGIFSPEKNYSIITHSKSVTKTPFISSITYPDGHNVLFNYGKPRVDLTGDSVLASVDITYQGRYLSKYQLTTGYFILNRYGNPTSDFQKQCARLCLRSVKKIGVDLKADDPPYAFDYHLGSSAPGNFIPPPFYHLKDIWGFYNGSSSVDKNGNPIPYTNPVSALSNNDIKGLCFNGNTVFNAKPGYAKNGLLRQITYPTGGSLNYEYAQNSAMENGQNMTIGGVHVSSTSLTDGGYQNDCNNAIVTNYKYSLDGNTQSSYWGFETPRNTLTTNNSYLPANKYFYLRGFPPGFGCDYKYKYPGILAREQAVNISWLGQTLQTAMNIVSTVSTILDVIKVVSGGDPVLLIIQVVLEIGLTCIGDHHVDNTTDIYYNSDLNSSNPLPGQFKRVEVIENAGANGKTVYDFTSDDDYPLWVPANTNVAFSAQQRFAPWAYSLPESTTVFDAAGNKIIETINTYGYNDEDCIIHPGVPCPNKKIKAPLNLISAKCLVKKSISKTVIDWNDPAQYNSFYVTQSGNDMSVNIYDLYTGRLDLITTSEKKFKINDPLQYVETVANYKYSSANYQIREINTTLSDGKKNFKKFAYTGDANRYWTTSDVEINALYQNNILLELVITEESIGDVSPVHLINQKLTKYTTVSNGNIKESEIREKRVAQPNYGVSGEHLIYQTGGSDYKTIQTFTYDAASNLSGLKDEGNRTVANIYDYNDKFIVASVMNADPSQNGIAYSSFEADGWGGWEVNSGSVVSNGVVTGNKSFSGSVMKSLPVPGNYIVSVWSTGTSNPSVNGQLLTQSPKATVGQWKLFEIMLAGISNVTVSGDNIDELRLYPTGAKMRTVTYDPLVGKTSECDENNRISYYEYDEKGRLRFMKDENGNVTKMYEYNIAKKPTGCPVTYYNLAVSEIFTKNNCAPGFMGSTVTYIIPEGRYTSTISQDAVDQQVQNELNTYGQAYANANGTCIPLFSNIDISQTFTKEGCDIGYEGTTITYTVPAGRYTSTISQADADEQAQDDIDANGQAFANFPGNASCVISYTPVWRGTGLEQCQNGNKLVQVVDQNPNSSSYNQTQWIDTGADPACGSSGCDINNCNLEDKRCVNGVCETGYKVYTQSDYVQVGSEWKFRCTYHYEWSDGYWSPDSYEYSDYPCPLQ